MFKDNQTKRKSIIELSLIYRNAEEEFAHSDMNGSAETKNVWESISNLCDFSSKTGPKSQKDASRIRQIFLQMKSSPPTKVN